MGDGRKQSTAAARRKPHRRRDQAMGIGGALAKSREKLTGKTAMALDGIKMEPKARAAIHGVTARFSTEWRLR